MIRRVVLRREAGRDEKYLLAFMEECEIWVREKSRKSFS
jgi:hypothetical protein